MWFNIDINRLVELLTPTFLRKEKHLAWLRALHFPLNELVYIFNQNRKDNLYNLAHNGQVCYLRKVLNDEFDRTERRIKIEDGNRYQRQYIYTDGEQKPYFLAISHKPNAGGKIMYLHDDANYSDTGVDFIVLVPQNLTYNEYKMKALLDFYKLASKRYKIEIMP
ncbi:MAG: hypothetical protein Q4C75_02770 [Bergeyella zoohelcum]|nr:hypothetical protein [Bergeyella zoohelcum]